MTLFESFHFDFPTQRYLAGMAGGIILDPLPIGPLASASASGFTTVTLTPIKEESSASQFCRAGLFMIHAGG